jgi:peroxiredoxin
MRRVAVTAGLLALLFAFTLTAPARAEAPKIGAAAPSFELQGTDGKTHKLEDYKGKIVVVYFHSTECPWAKGYQPLINGLETKYGTAEKDGKKSEQVVFVGINSNKAEDMAAIKASSEHYKTPHAILKDPGNQVADAYNATATPHFFVIDATGKLRYMGGYEKAPTSPGSVGKSGEQYLEPVLQALLAGKEPPYTVTRETGCSIKRAAKQG